MARVSKDDRLRVQSPSFETRRFRDAPQDEASKNKKEYVLHILVLGAAGMVGRKLVERLLRRWPARHKRYHADDAA